MSEITRPTYCRDHWNTSKLFNGQRLVFNISAFAKGGTNFHESTLQAIILKAFEQDARIVDICRTDEQILGPLGKIMRQYREAPLYIISGISPTYKASGRMQNISFNIETIRTKLFEILEHLSRRMPELGRTFVQAESEVAAINMVYGAACTGVRVMSTSSSPGVSLMMEGLLVIMERILKVKLGFM